MVNRSFCDISTSCFSNYIKETSAFLPHFTIRRRQKTKKAQAAGKREVTVLNDHAGPPNCDRVKPHHTRTGVPSPLLFLFSEKGQWRCKEILPVVKVTGTQHGEEAESRTQAVPPATPALAVSVRAEVRRPSESASLPWEILQSFSNSSRLWLKHPNDCVIAFHSLPFPTKAEMGGNIENLQSTDSQQPVPFPFCH